MMTTEVALSLMLQAKRELPYEGAKEILLVEDVGSKELLAKPVNPVCGQ